MEEDIVIQKKLIQMVIRQLAKRLKDIEADHIMMVQELLYKTVGKQVDLPYNICAVREYDAICLFMKGESNHRAIESKNLAGEEINISVKIPGDYIILPMGETISFEIMERKEKNIVIPKNNCTKWFDYDKIKNTIFIRNRKIGDYIQVDNAGGHKKLKAYLIDKKFPKQDRDKIPLLADGSHIIWILGDRISEYYKVSEETTKILIVNLHGGTTSGRQD
jgi:tRNA(Ile)-lysidine synthase